MVRTHVQLDPRQLDALRRVAQERGCSVSELIRRSVDRYLTELTTTDEERVRRALAAVGRFRSGVPDLGSAHDKYLDDAFDA
ncbi:ribbon-helix-helix domain-containing protein [Deferrisoma sp.]|nr:MAG: ribbon-helix-helix protein, CopG family [Candidatus Dadabacteria bacterium]